MTTLDQSPPRLDNVALDKATAKVAAQKKKLASIDFTDSQRRIEEILLCSMNQNVSVKQFAAAIDLSRTDEP